MQSRAKPQPPQGFSHFGKNQLGLIAEGKQSFRAAQLFSRKGDVQYLFRRHGVRAVLSRVAAEGAVSAVIAAEVCEGNENFARIGDYTGLETITSIPRSRQQFRKLLVPCLNPVNGFFTRECGRVVESCRR